MNKITVVGSLLIDMVGRLERFPEVGETLMVDEYGEFLGGKGANQCVAIRRLGGNVEMIGMTGDDAGRQKYLKLFADEGIICDNVFTNTEIPTGFAQIHIDKNAQNKIVVIPGANLMFGLEHLKAVDEVLAKSDIVVTQLEFPRHVSVELLKRCKELGVPVLLNPAPATALELDVLALAEYITPNELELATLAGMPTETEEELYAAAQKLLDAGVKNIIATIGEKGALIANAEGFRVVKGYNVDCIDTVGAGDSFTAALAVALTEGKTLDEAASFANAMGALTVTERGAIPSLHTRAQVDEFIKSQTR